DGEIWSLSNNDFNNEILVGINKGIVSLDLKNNNIRNDYIGKDYLEVKKRLSVDNEIFIKSYDGKLFEIKNNNKKMLMTDVLDIGSYEGNLFISTNNGLYKYRKGNLKKSSSIIYDFLSKTEGELYGINKNKIYNIKR